MAALSPSAELTARTILLLLTFSLPEQALLHFRAPNSPPPARGIRHSCFRTTVTFWWLEEPPAAPPSRPRSSTRPGLAPPASLARWHRRVRALRAAPCFKPCSAHLSASTAHCWSRVAWMHPRLPRRYKALSSTASLPLRQINRITRRVTL